MRKRPIELKFRLSQDEYEHLQKNLVAAGMQRNPYLVRLITGSKIYPKDQLIRLNLEFGIMNRLLRGIGTNINQIARATNITHTPPPSALVLDMAQEIQILRENLAALWEDIRRELWQS